VSIQAVGPANHLFEAMACSEMLDRSTADRVLGNERTQTRQCDTFSKSGFIAS
jgi:hypothetical protein